MLPVLAGIADLGNTSVPQSFRLSGRGLTGSANAVGFDSELGTGQPGACGISKAKSGKWKVESGKWKVESGKWKVESGKWKVESGK